MPNYTIREAVPADARQLLAHLKRITAEPDSNIALTADEAARMSVEDEIHWIRNFQKTDNSVLLVAEADGQIVGVLDCNGGQRQLLRHVGVIGIVVHPDWRDKGVGTALMQQAIQWAKDSGIIARLELDVFAQNARAIHVYEKVGFAAEGRKAHAYRRDGQYIDSLIMSLLLD
jgi:RimJ/RimL family protein N-acetyltransferase